jgi:signal transduction histidine kinase
VLSPRHAIEHGRALLLSEVGPPPADHDELARTAWRIVAPRSAILVPVQTPSSVLGVISLGRSRRRRPFETADLALAEGLARLAGHAVNNGRLYEQAQEANRLKDEFIATLSHELRTPLNAVLGWTTMLRKGTVLDPAQRERALMIIERNAHAQARLLDDTLDTARIVTNKLTVARVAVELWAIVEKAVESMQPSAIDKGVELTARPIPMSAIVMGDAARLEQIIWNLLSNALKFTPRGGHVRVSGEVSGTQVILTVRDNGIGIPLAFLPFVFERFRQADTSTTRGQGGLGLGLALVRHLVELHRGTVEAASAGEGHGATLTVRLPIARRTLANSADPDQGPVVRPLTGLNVLIVDDDHDARELASLTLEHAGATTRVASGTVEALAVLDDWCADILLVDLAMPGQDGLVFLRQARQRGVLVPAVAVTAHARPQDRQRSADAGFALLFAKPINPDYMVSMVASLAGHVPSRSPLGVELE